MFYAYTQFLLPKFLFNKQYVRFVADALLVTGLFVYLRYEVRVSIVPFLSNQQLVYPYSTLRIFVAETLWRGGYFLIITLGYWFASKSVKEERERRRLEQQKRKDEQRLRIMEASLKDAEIAYLNRSTPIFYSTPSTFSTIRFILIPKKSRKGYCCFPRSCVTRWKRMRPMTK